jgi:hypothetical protein
MARIMNSSGEWLPYYQISFCHIVPSSFNDGGETGYDIFINIQMFIYISLLKQNNDLAFSF